MGVWRGVDTAGRSRSCSCSGNTRQVGLPPPPATHTHLVVYPAASGGGIVGGSGAGAADACRVGEVAGGEEGGVLQSKARRAAPLRRVARTDPPTTSTPTRPPSSPHPPTRVLGHALQDHLILHHQLTRGAHTQRLQAEGGGGDRQVGDEGWGGTRVRVHAGCVWAGERTRRRGAQVSAGWWPGSLTPPSLPVAARLGDVLRGVHARQHAQGEAGGLAAAVVRLGGGGGVRGWVGGWVVGRGEEGRDGTRACAHTLSWACCQGRWPLRLLSSPPPPVAAPSRPLNPPPPPPCALPAR